MGEALARPFRLGPLELPHRVVMAPMTRNRAGLGTAPHALNAEYYGQRASAALVITEATQVSAQGVGVPADARHPFARTGGGLAGGDRRGAPRRRADRAPALACRADLALLAPAGRGAARGPVGHRRRRRGDDLRGHEARSRRRARSRRTRSPASSRSSAWAPATPWRRGSTRSRSMAATAICSTSSSATAPTPAATPMAGRWRTGCACRSRSPKPWPGSGAPTGWATGCRPISASTTWRTAPRRATFAALAGALDGIGLAWLHVVESDAPGRDAEEGDPAAFVAARPPLFRTLRESFGRALIANSAYDGPRGAALLDAGQADLVSYATLFLANPGPAPAAERAPGR